VTRAWLVRELTERAVFLRWNEKINDYKVIDCPANVATTLESGTDDFTFRPLTALANAPFLRVDGSICDSPGYDEATGIYYAPSLTFPAISAAPTWHEAREALDSISHLVKQFPFANAVSRSVFLSDALTAIARPTLPKSPVVLYNATMAGSGKTLMASIANLIAYGHATTHPWPGVNEEELKKVFTSVLIAGDPVVVFDNLPNGAMIKSAALSQFATSDDYADRKLGVSERVKFRNRTRVVLTGNNITLASDNARRTLVCDLQLEVESIKDRNVEFEYPSLALHIKQNRAFYISAALTVLKAYAVHDDHLMLTPLDSFEDWSWRVREALVWLGEEDPVAAVNYENDGSGEIANVFEIIQSIVNTKRSASKDQDFRSTDLANWAASNIALRDALEQAGCLDTNSSGKLGYWLRAHKNRISGGLKLVTLVVSGGRQPNKWQLLDLSKQNN
jgi:putative DNA primase/helicase